jgi:hypothetical protein
MHLFGRYNIDIHDYSVRLRAAKKFLKAGDKVIKLLRCYIIIRVVKLITLDHCFRLRLW